MKRTILFITFLMMTGCSTTYNLRYPPERWLRDNDKVPIELKKMVKNERQFYAGGITGQMISLMEHSEGISEIATSPMRGHLEAVNLNNFDEVADSTWFTNRVGRTGRVDIDALGFTFTPPFTVYEAGMISENRWLLVVRDAEKKKYTITFDESGKDEMATGGEVITSNLLYAAGYNVQRIKIVALGRKDIKLNMSVSCSGTKVASCPFTVKTLEEFFKKKKDTRVAIAELPDAYFLGRFKFKGKRREDTNDRITHENRRELRGYRVFASLLNISNAGERNALDVFVQTSEGKGYIRHYLVFFSKALSGIGDIKKTNMKSATQYRRAVGNLFAFGLYDPYWTASEPEVQESVSDFNARAFAPGKWNSSKMTVAFREMTARDAFWASKLLARFTDGDIRDIVKMAKFSDPKIEEFVTENLIVRRNKITIYWFSKINPLDDFELRPSGNGYVITFNDLYPARGALHWFRLTTKNATRTLYEWPQAPEHFVTISAETLNKMDEGKTYMLQTRGKGKNDKWLGPSIDLFIRKDQGALKLLGLKRRY